MGRFSCSINGSLVELAQNEVVSIGGHFTVIILIFRKVCFLGHDV